MPPPFILATIPRSGTHWLSNMLISLGLKGVSRSKPDLSYDELASQTKDQCRRLKSREFYFDHIRYSWVDEILEEIDIKVLLLYRDPRDNIISQYYYSKNRLECLSGSFEDSFETIQKEALVHYNKIALPWLSHGNLLRLKYEDLVTNTGECLSKIANFLDITPSDKMLTNAIQQYCFKKLSDGRLPGQEDRHHHYRKGIVGDWRNYFSETITARYKEVFGSVHEQLGYDFK